LKQHQQDATPTEESYQHGAQAEGERDRDGPLLGPRKGEVSLGGLQLSNRRGYLDILSYGLMLRASLRAERPAPRIAVILTATIDPGGTPLLTLRDPEQRLADYLRAFRSWLATTYPLVVCENSGADLAPLRAIADEGGRPVELLGYNDNTAAQSRGKGAGEAEILRHVLAESKTAADADLLMKVSGRYYIRNVDRLLRRTLSLGDADSYADLWWWFRDAQSDCFLATRNFIARYLLPHAEAIDDSAGFYLEHALARAVQSSLADGGRWLPLGLAPDLIGTSGTFGWTRAESLPRRLVGELRRRVALEILCHGPRGRWRPKGPTDIAVRSSER
jgi:hypothetical protein